MNRHMCININFDKHFLYYCNLITEFYFKTRLFVNMKQELTFKITGVLGSTARLHSFFYNKNDAQNQTLLNYH